MYVEADGTLFDIGYVVSGMSSFNKYTVANGVTYCDVGQLLISEGKIYQFSIRTYIDNNEYKFKLAYFYSGYCAIWYVTNYKNPN